MKKIRFILNPMAGHRKAPLLKKLIEEFNTDGNAEFEVVHTDYAGHAVLLAREAAQLNYHGVIAVGGDGTVNEIATGLLNSSTLLGILPMGSGNGLALHLGYSMKPAKALRQILNSTETSIDTIAINDRIMVNVSGMGFDGYVANLFNASGKRGLNSYTRVSLQAYGGYKIASFTFDHEGRKTIFKKHMMVIANASQFGNKAIIAPHAQLADGLMDVVFVEKPPFYLLPILFLRMFTGKIKDNQYIQTIRCSSFEVTSDRPLHLHIDGESVAPLDKLNVKIVPLSLRIMQVVSFN